MAKPLAKPTPGRPRDPHVDDAIATSAFDVLSERGFDGFAIEEVAARAGVGKTTIYRRYADKNELILDALVRVLPPQPELPDSGDTRRDLLELVRYVNDLLHERLALVAAMLAVRLREPELATRFREHHVMPRRLVMHRVIERGQVRGDIRTGMAPSVVADAIMGSLMERYLLSSDPNTGDHVADDVVAAIWPMIATDQAPS